MQDQVQDQVQDKDEVETRNPTTMQTSSRPPVSKELVCYRKSVNHGEDQQGHRFRAQVLCQGISSKPLRSDAAQPF